jgi:serine protease inhibitor
LLQRLGIKKAFSKNDADFSGISDNLYIDKILQHAFIEVNEKGTEAAAATAVKVVKRSIEKSIDIVLNRPFIFLITDKSNGLILFNGIFRGSIQTKSENTKDEL